MNSINVIRVTDDAAFQDSALRKDISQMPSNMVLREHVQHAIDYATVSGTSPSVTVMGLNIGGHDRVAFFNDAPGMNFDKLCKFATELRWSSREDKPNDAADNFGWGVRTVSMKASPLGTEFYNIHEGEVSKVTFYLTDEGYPRSVGPEPATLPEAFTRKHGHTPAQGVLAILLGEEGRENTFAKPFPGGAQTRLYNFVAQRYWTTGGANLSLHREMRRGRNGVDLPGLGDWLNAQALRRTQGKDSQLREKIIRHREGDVEVVIFTAYKMTNNKPTSDMIVGAAMSSPGSAIVHGPEMYRWNSGGNHKRLLSYCGLSTVADVVSVLVILHDNDMVRVTNDRSRLQFVSGFSYQTGDAIEDIADPDEEVALRHFRHIIENTVKLPQAKWLRDLREERRKANRREDDVAARLRLHKLAAELNLLNKEGVKIDDDGNIIVDDDGINGREKKKRKRQGPGPNPNPTPGPSPRPGPKPNPNGQRRGSATAFLTTREFDVTSSDSMDNVNAFEWLDWVNPEECATLQYNPGFTLFSQLRTLLINKYDGKVHPGDVEACFHAAMVKTLKVLLVPHFLINRLRMLKGDMQTSLTEAEVVERMWGSEGANAMLSVWFDLQSAVIADVAEQVKAKLAQQAA